MVCRKPGETNYEDELLLSSSLVIVINGSTHFLPTFHWLDHDWSMTVSWFSLPYFSHKDFLSLVLANFQVFRATKFLEIYRWSQWEEHGLGREGISVSLPKGAILSRKIDLYSLEISCNLGTSPGQWPVWKYYIVKRRHGVIISLPAYVWHWRSVTFSFSARKKYFCHFTLSEGTRTLIALSSNLDFILSHCAWFFWYTLAPFLSTLERSLPSLHGQVSIFKNSMILILEMHLCGKALLSCTTQHNEE